MCEGYFTAEDSKSAIQYVTYNTETVSDELHGIAAITQDAAKKAAVVLAMTLIKAGPEALIGAVEGLFSAGVHLGITMSGQNYRIKNMTADEARAADEGAQVEESEPETVAAD